MGGVGRLAGAQLLALLLSANVALGFQSSRISEIMTSYDEPFLTVQFVEIEMPLFGENEVANTVFAAFDASGAYVADVLVVPSDLPVAFDVPARWLVGTSDISLVRGGVQPTFSITGNLPVDGGMICWGAPTSPAPDPGTWDHSDPENYVDCVAYGSYSGPANSLIGSPTPLDADGHSLVRVFDTGDNASDFLCGDPATPENSALFFADAFPATTPCPVPNNYTLPAPLAFSGEGISGTVNPVTSASAISGIPDCTFLDPCFRRDNILRGVGYIPDSCTSPTIQLNALLLPVLQKKDYFFRTDPFPYCIIGLAHPLEDHHSGIRLLPFQ